MREKTNSRYYKVAEKLKKGASKFLEEKEK